MKSACIVLTVLILVAIMAVCIMVKFATEITLQEKKREYLAGDGDVNFENPIGVIMLNQYFSKSMSERFPYVVAIQRNSSNKWTFTCFGSVVLANWIITSAHCRHKGATHQVLIYHDYVRNYSHKHPILFWRLHEKFNRNHTSLRYDIAAAKLNLDSHPYSLKPSTFDEQLVHSYLEASIWKTVSTMDKKIFLTNDFDEFHVTIAANTKCFESYGLELDDSLICVDLSAYDDCFVHEFGPLYAGDKIVGVLAVKPRDCETKLAVFTNVSFYSNWILKSTHTNYLKKGIS